jgi:hypothetical protein
MMRRSITSGLRTAYRLGLGPAAFLGIVVAVATGCTDAGRCELGTPGCVTGGSGALCSNTCEYAGDGECDDSGLGSDWDACAFGTDCEDCGEREALTCSDPDFPVFCEQGDTCWGDGVDCWTVRECPDGNVYGCIEGFLLDCTLAVAGEPNYCVAADVCDDSCPTADDGTCDDGGPCLFGTDCTDCGPRDNPCDDSSPFPRYCPGTPGTDECWSRRVDCDAVQYCDGDPLACREGERVDCDALSGCAATTCTDADLPVDCGTGTCFPVGIDCTTVATCGVAEVGCPFGFELDCSVPLTPECLPPD